jgi:hypothetical protein
VFAVKIEIALRFFRSNYGEDFSVPTPLEPEIEIDFTKVRRIRLIFNNCLVLL